MPGSTSSFSTLSGSANNGVLQYRNGFYDKINNRYGKMRYHPENMFTLSATKALRHKDTLSILVCRPLVSFCLRGNKKGKLFAAKNQSFVPVYYSSLFKPYVMSKTLHPETKIAKKILLVEDEGEIGVALDLILSARQLELDYVNTLLDADEYLHKYKPAVIILDNKLPDGFGVDFISYVRKKYPDIKIIMISGFSTARDVALNNGADIFLEKPFSMDKINEAMDKVLG